MDPIAVFFFYPLPCTVTMYRPLIKLVPRLRLHSTKFVSGRQKMRHTLPACRQAGLHRDSYVAKISGLCPVLSSGNTPPRHSGSFAATAPFWLFAKNTNLVF